MREQEGEDEDRTAMWFIIIITVLVIGGILFAVLTGGGH